MHCLDIEVNHLSERSETVIEPRRRFLVVLSAVIILSIAWSVLILRFPPGMETGAALLVITPFAMCIIVVEGSIWFAQYVKNVHENMHEK